MLRRSLFVVAATALAAAGTSWAASGSHSVRVTLTEPTLVGQTMMAPGDYHFSWTDATDTVGVTIGSDRSDRAVAHVEASLQRRTQAYSRQEEVFKAGRPGTRILEEIRLRGDAGVLVFPAS